MIDALAYADHVITKLAAHLKYYPSHHELQVLMGKLLKDRLRLLEGDFHVAISEAGKEFTISAPLPRSISQARSRLASDPVLQSVFNKQKFKYRFIIGGGPR